MPDTDGTIYELTGAPGTPKIFTLPGPANPAAITEDSSGNLRATTPKREGSTAGSDTLPAVLSQKLTVAPPFGPVNDEPWLTITAVTNGEIPHFEDGANGRD